MNLFVLVLLERIEQILLGVDKYNIDDTKYKSTIKLYTSEKQFQTF